MWLGSIILSLWIAITLPLIIVGFVFFVAWLTEWLEKKEKVEE